MPRWPSQGEGGEMPISLAQAQRLQSIQVIPNSWSSTVQLLPGQQPEAQCGIPSVPL